jgi:peptidoglycan/xylan/chitin deacetylase (PgdA/CDA1 family)
MPRHVTIVMYHFVRALRRSRYPSLRARDVDAFEGQLGYLLRHHRVVRMEDVIAAVHDPQRHLPAGAVLLTFDDGYADHFDIVFPLLDRLGLQGSFFVPARPVVERRVLDVNKIHLLLATTSDPSVLVRSMEAHIEAGRAEVALEEIAHYRATYAHPNRWDDAVTVYLKRMLQKGLPQPLRTEVVDALFRAFVSSDESTVAEELYLSVEQLHCMRRHGMHVGAHGWDHSWLDELDPTALEHEVSASLEFLDALGCEREAWTISYPFGGFDDRVRAMTAGLGARLGLTTVVATADLDRDDALALPRIDTNDLPTHADASPVQWTEHPMGG